MTLDHLLLRNQSASPDHQPSSSTTRHAVISDMSSFLKEAEQKGRMDSRQAEAARIQGTRDGLLPFKVKKGR